MKRTVDEPHLVLLRSTPEERQHRFSLPEGVTRVGRSPRNDICLPHPTVSRFHCRLQRRGQRVRLVDVAEHNRTLVDNSPAVDRVLSDGAVLRLGRCRLVFREAGGRPRRKKPLSKARKRPARTAAFIGTVFAAGTVVAVLAVWALTRSPDGEEPQVVLVPAVSESEPPGSPPESREEAPAPRRALDEALALLADESDADVDAGDVGLDIDGGEADTDVRAIDPDTSAGAEPGSEASRLSPPDEDVADDDTSLVEARRAKGGTSYFDTHVAPFLAKYCIACHNDEKKKGDLAFDMHVDVAMAAKDRELWGKVAEKLRTREMPPRTRRQPASAEVSSVIDWIDDAVFDLGADGSIDPGRVTMRRLNNYEYNYTIRDLVGLDLKPADDFPADDIGYGFDNIGDLLSIPPLLMEKYLTSAEKIVRAVAADETAWKRIVTCTPTSRAERAACAREVIERFAARAFRRPVSAKEVTRLAKLVDLAVRKGDGFEKGIELALQAILVSPHFLFRVELDGEPNNPATIRPVTDHEIASRLSYFLWSSMPDDELFELARNGTLRRPDVLEEQVKRMLADRKARGLIKTFSALWLGSREMKTVSPDPGIFPDFDEELRRAMRRETEQFFDEIMRKDLSVLLFLDADFTFLNERLARHYGIDGVKGGELRRVKLDNGRRGGVLTQATVLTVTSNPTRTSPVQRGKWILEQILGTPPPPPPPGLDSLQEDERAVVSGTLRQRMKQHRTDPSCANCHEKMDTLGFALENYDATGAWREKDGKFAIDPSGTLPDGRSFADIGELKRILLSQKEEFCRCLTEKMLTFALGRGLEYKDKKIVERIARSLEESGYRFSALVLEIVKSDPFQKRRGERVTP